MDATFPHARAHVQARVEARVRAPRRPGLAHPGCVHSADPTPNTTSGGTPRDTSDPDARTCARATAAGRRTYAAAAGRRAAAAGHPRGVLAPRTG